LDEQYRIKRLFGLRFDYRSEELRLIFQPLYKRSTITRPEAEDAALHLFLRMPKLQMLQAQRTLAGVYPDIRTPLDAGPLKRLLCQATKLELVKIIFMNVRRRRVIWNFGGFHIINHSLGHRTPGPDVEIPNAQGIFPELPVVKICFSCHATESARVFLEVQFHSRASHNAYSLTASYNLATISLSKRRRRFRFFCPSDPHPHTDAATVPDDICPRQDICA
jgi:hypothetical protein